MTFWQKVVALKKQGLTPPEIATRLETTGNNVHAALSRYAASQKRIAVYIDGPVRKKLLKAARARGIKPDALAAKLLSAVAEDNIFDAVLDDVA